MIYMLTYIDVDYYYKYPKNRRCRKSRRVIVLFQLDDQITNIKNIKNQDGCTNNR